MKPNYGLLLLFTLLYSLTVESQAIAGYKWQDPSESITRFDGQGWENMGYSRLPDTAENVVRDAVWSLSRQAAGISLRFETNADSIAITYQVVGNLAMPHMPATGVSGIDLYVKNENDWLWCHGKYQYNNTIRYDFKVDRLSKGMRRYELFFPLYNTIKNLRIGVNSESSLKFTQARTQKPIVVYGTSIAQGACASRPGMGWTNILARKLDYPVINLGFSGNGRLEPEVIDFVNEIDASVFILDCLPNLPPSRGYDQDEIHKRIRNSIESLRKKHAETPILLVHHAGYSDGLVDLERSRVYESLNRWTTEIFENLKNEGAENLFLLTIDEIALSNDATVDGTHPNDLGMQQYADAYENVVKALILKAK